MKGGINQEFVGVHPDLGGDWSFIIPSNTRKLSECLDDWITFSNRLFDACAGFVRPVKIEYSVQRFAEDGPADLAVSPDHCSGPKFLDVERHQISDISGITYIPIKPSYSEGDNVICIGDVEFVRSETRMRLASFDGWIDRTNPERINLTRFGQVQDNVPKSDPIHLKVSHFTSPKYTEFNTLYHLLVGTPSDIWFENTEIGRTNRSRLTDFFSRIMNAFDVLEVRVDSVSQNEETLLGILPQIP